jgi:RNA polymerase sigma factor (sigma-70 family)
MTPKSLIAPARLARRPVLATQTDTRLVDLARAGYEPAFETIVSRYRAALLRYAERFLSRERAEDAVQQSFVSAYEAMLRDDSALNLRPWLYRIAHNASLNALRDRGLRHSELDENIDGVERPDQALERAQGLGDVLTAVQALPERQRDAIVLRELEGRSYDEIAAELGVSNGSVRQLLNRARNSLRAGATAVVPVGLLLRLPWVAPAEPIAARVAELGAGAGAGAVLAKLTATALVTGAVVGGVAVAPEIGKKERGGGPDRAAASQPADQAEPAAPPTPPSAGGEQFSSGEGEADSSGSRGGQDDDGRRGRRRGEDSDERSGRGGGDDSGGGGDNSGPGSGSGDRSGGSGSGTSSGSGSGSGSDSESGSGSSSSGSGSGGDVSTAASGSGSGSGSSSNSGSGSGSSGSDSGDSGSGDNSGSG